MRKEPNKRAKRFRQQTNGGASRSHARRKRPQLDTHPDVQMRQPGKKLHTRGGHAYGMRWCVPERRYTLGHTDFGACLLRELELEERPLASHAYVDLDKLRHMCKHSSQFRQTQARLARTCAILGLHTCKPGCTYATLVCTNCKVCLQSVNIL